MNTISETALPTFQVALKIVFKVDLALARYQSPYQQLLLLPERRALMGSVSTYIVNHAACPVTVVKENM